MTWLVPHSVAQVLPKDVDFRVMLTFLDFYHTLLQFALFKLYHGLGLTYPPVVRPEMDRASAELAGIMKELGGAQEEEAAERARTAAALTGALPSFCAAYFQVTLFSSLRSPLPLSCVLCSMAQDQRLANTLGMSGNKEVAVTVHFARCMGMCHIRVAGDAMAAWSSERFIWVA